ncbi:MAG TPA: DUF6636 domain-containing protein [Solirubrobacterales bacterium]|jgi:hypothetical protein|nr:DUF6636 domain-containing protein [Solirubrobacterales bacterium]
MRKVLVVLVGAALASTGCGGGSTTIIERTVVTERAPAKTYLPASGIVAKYVEPAEYSFYVDGAVVGTDLTWQGWGSPTATARGSIEIRDPEGEGMQDRLRFPGSIEASGREECRGAAYYTQALAKLPPGAPYHPEGPMPLSTPCRDPASLGPVPAPPESGTPSPVPPSDEVRFATPSGNIECSLSSEAATCEIFRRSFTPSAPKPVDCMLDYGHRLTVDSSGTASFACYGDSMRGIAERKLSYGDFLERGPMTCKSEPAGVTCGTGSGAFFLSVQRADLSG